MTSGARGRLYVDKDVQRALLWQLFRHWALFVTVLMGMLLAIEALNANPQPTWGGFFRAAWQRHAPLLLVVATLFPVFAYDSIKLSHRFVGPILRLRGAMRQAALGQPVKNLQFRKEDFWQDMACSFNALIERLPTSSADECRDQGNVPNARREPVLTGAARAADDVQEV
jgi:hypothetical protein